MPSQAYLDLLTFLADLHVRKSAGYSGADNPDAWANFRRCAEFGIRVEDGILTRMSDKWSRLQSLRRNPDNDQVGEGVEDTLIDLASYALTLVCILREQKPPDPDIEKFRAFLRVPR